MPFSRLPWYSIAILSIYLLITTGCGAPTTDTAPTNNDNSQATTPISSQVPTAYDNRTPRPTDPALQAFCQQLIQQTFHMRGI